MRPHLFHSTQKCFFRDFDRQRFRRGITPVLKRGIRFYRSGRDVDSCNIVQNLRFRQPPCARDGLMHYMGNQILSITISVHGNSPACNGRITMRVARSGRIRFFVPGNFTRKFTMLSRATIFRCGYSGFCRPRTSKNVSILSRSLNVS